MRMTTPARVAGLLLSTALALSGCGAAGGAADDGGAGTDGSGAFTGGDGAAGNAEREEMALRFAECLREHGVDVDDPQPGQGLRLTFGPDTDRQVVDAAMEACRKYSPQGTGAGSNPEMAARAQAFAECMRENGVAAFEDPAPGAPGLTINPQVQQDPDFESARETCMRHLPGLTGGQSR